MPRGMIDVNKVSMAYVTKGIDGILALESRFNETASKNVLSKALDGLVEQGVDVEALGDLLSERHPESGGQRGRKAVQIGETRIYTVGQVLPLSNPWGFPKGSKVRVRFTPEGCLITPED